MGRHDHPADGAGIGNEHIVLPRRPLSCDPDPVGDGHVGLAPLDRNAGGAVVGKRLNLKL